MKTIRVIGMALFAVLLSVGLASCSKDELNANNTSKKEKKLISLVDDYTTRFFKYDDNGQLVRVEKTEVADNGQITKYTINYTWTSGYVIERNEYFDDENVYILSDDRVTKVKGLEGDNVIHEFTYNNSKELNRVCQQPLDEHSFACSYTWKNRNLIEGKTDNDFLMTIEYNNVPCKGINPMFIWELLFDSPLHLAHPELFGIKTANLPIKMNIDNQRIYEFSYTYTSDGYVDSITEVETRYNGNTSTEKYILVWE